MFDIKVDFEGEKEGKSERPYPKETVCILYSLVKFKEKPNTRGLIPYDTEKL